MNIVQIEEAVQELVQDLSPDTFVYRFLKAFGKAKSIVSRVQSGDFNKSKAPGEVIWNKVLFFRPVYDMDLHTAVDQLRKSDLPAKHSVRFIVVTDFKELLGVDVRTEETLDIPIIELPSVAVLPAVAARAARSKLVRKLLVRPAGKGEGGC